MKRRPGDFPLLGLLCCYLAGWGTTPAIAAEPVNPGQAAMLHLANGDRVAGELIGLQDSSRLVWQARDFITAFEFDLDVVDAIEFPRPAALRLPSSDYRFELSGGDVLYGSLVSLRNQEAELDVPEWGRLHVDLAAMRRISRWQTPVGLVYDGPGRLEGWTTDNGWREENGKLVSGRDKTWLRRDVGLPHRSRMEFVISWQPATDFELALGAGSNVPPFRMEIWEERLVLLRETMSNSNSDVVVLDSVPVRPSRRIHLQAFLDRSRGRVLVYSSGGKQLADLTVATDQELSSEIQLTNRLGVTRLELLRVGQWNGEPPPPAPVGQIRILVVDGSSRLGRVTSYDAGRHEFVLAGTEKPISEDAIQDLVFSQADERPPGSLQVQFTSGQQMTGHLRKVESDKIWLQRSGIREDLVCDISWLQSVTSLVARDAVVVARERPPAAVSADRLETMQSVLHGSLVDTETIDSPCLNWKPSLSPTTSALRKEVSARIFAADRRRRETTAVAVGKPADARAPNEAPRNSAPSPKRSTPRIFLRSGDVLECPEVVVDDRGFTFSARDAGTASLPQDQVLALDFNRETPAAAIGEPKKQRFLTLPRIQRDNPPTHIIQSMNGDCLRCRLISMDQATIRVEARSQETAIPRDRVARMFLLPPDHPPKNQAEQATQKLLPVDAEQGIVQALFRDGNRLTVTPELITGTFLLGEHRQLGDSRIDLRQLDRLLIGRAIETAEASAPFGLWRLQPAIDPKAYSELADDEQKSDWIGRPAPEIALKFLDGKAFRLSEHKGQVVVVDFFASWCQPCRAAMPQVAAVVRDFRIQGLELYAINLQETEREAQAVLDRLELKIPVLMDQNGQIGKRYGVESIPQTFVIDRQGTVRHVFLGEKNLGARLREALQKVVADQSEPVK